MRTRKTFRISDNQGSLPFREKGSGILAQAPVRERQALILMGSLFVLLSICYIYFLAESVAHVSTRESLLSEARTLSGKTAELEANYLAESQKFTEPYAQSSGFVHVNKTAFVEKAQSLSVAGN